MNRRNQGKRMNRRNKGERDLLGKLINKMMKAKNLTQSKLADNVKQRLQEKFRENNININQSTIKRWIKGETSLPTDDELIAIADCLGLEVGTLASVRVLAESRCLEKKHLYSTAIQELMYGTKGSLFIAGYDVADIASYLLGMASENKLPQKITLVLPDPKPDKTNEEGAEKGKVNNKGTNDGDISPLGNLESVVDGMRSGRLSASWLLTRQIVSLLRNPIGKSKLDIRFHITREYLPAKIVSNGEVAFIVYEKKRWLGETELKYWPKDRDDQKPTILKELESISKTTVGSSTKNQDEALKSLKEGMQAMSEDWSDISCKLLSPEDSEIFEKCWKEILFESFPKDELEEFEEEKQIMDDGGIMVLMKENSLVAVACFRYLETASAAFVEYFAVHKDFRNMGLGGWLFHEMVRYLRDKYKEIKWIFGEAEIPSDNLEPNEKQKREVRLQLLAHAGFKEVDRSVCPYFQPKLRSRRNEGKPVEDIFLVAWSFDKRDPTTIETKVVWDAITDFFVSGFNIGREWWKDPYLNDSDTTDLTKRLHQAYEASQRSGSEISLLSLNPKR